MYVLYMSSDATVLEEETCSHEHHGDYSVQEHCKLQQCAKLFEHMCTHVHVYTCMCILFINVHIHVPGNEMVLTVASESWFW